MSARRRSPTFRHTSSVELLDALRTVARGGSYLSSQVSDRLLARIQRGDLETHDRSPLESLSPRELQVLRLVAEGKTSKDIAVAKPPFGEQRRRIWLNERPSRYSIAMK